MFAQNIEFHFNLVCRVLKVDPYYCPALIILVGCLMELKENNSE